MPHRQRFPATASRIAARVGFGFWSRRTLQDRIIPDVQKPHWSASAAMKASCSGVRRPSAASPSIVVIGLPAASCASVRHEQTVLPSRRTVQAPQAPRPQTTFVPVRPIRSRSASASVTRGSTESRWTEPLTWSSSGRGARTHALGLGRLRLAADRRRDRADEAASDQVTPCETAARFVAHTRLRTPDHTSDEGAGHLVGASPRAGASCAVGARVERLLAPQATIRGRAASADRPRRPGREAAETAPQRLRALDRRPTGEGPDPPAGGRRLQALDLGPERRPRPPRAPRVSVARRERVEQSEADEGGVVAAAGGRRLPEPPGELAPAGRRHPVEVAAGSVAGAEDPEEHPPPAPQTGEGAGRSGRSPRSRPDPCRRGATRARS